MSGVVGMKKGKTMPERKTEKVNTAFTSKDVKRIFKYQKAKNVTKSTAVHNLTVDGLELFESE